ncbi:hypothetical protein DFJ43DRAFT_1170417 [Lentinula guzmanii]|uniref:Uncharacterized protein n=1 Tax=Lentinula guzmanii TaxID=2804957 RepID=A0AA38MUQ6_9AGAR|nr:hypothetical protein DFJ43DRAFT_1170417 [Lentinula guzmanii]
MAITFDVTAAQIVGLFMECILYGVYLVSLGYCLRALLLDPFEQGLQRKKHINWVMLVVALLLCLFATLDVAFGLRHNLDAFSYYHGPGGATEELNDISYWVNVMKTADYVAQTFIGDGMLIYRCYIVYEKNWKIVIPSILFWLGGSVCGALLTYTFATLRSPALIDTSKAVPYVDTMIALSLTMNTLTTALIVGKIWSVDRQNATLMSNTTANAIRTSKLHRVMRIIIESAALYTISTLIFVITYVAGSNANYGTSDNVVQIIGISFNLIIIRVDAGKSYNGRIAESSTNLSSRQQPRNKPQSFPLSLFNTTTDSALNSNSDSEFTGRKGITLDVDVVHKYDDLEQGTNVTGESALKPLSSV